MAAPTQACNVKILLANREPSTHGTFETFGRDVRMSARGETGHCGNIVVGPNLTDAVEKVADEVGRAVRSAFESFFRPALCPPFWQDWFSAGVQHSLHV